MPKKKNGWPRSNRGWKDVQIKRQIARKTKIALLVLTTVLLFLVLSQTVKFTQSLFSPWKLVSSKNYLWNGNFNLNFLIKSKGIALVSFNPLAQKMIIINLPDSTFVDTAHGFGQWQLASIYGLGESGKLGGTVLLRLSLTNFFGLPIDGILNFSGKYADLSATKIIDEIRKSPFSLIDILPNLKTDLTPYELTRLKLGLSGVRFDKITQINLQDTGALEKSKLADGSDVYIADDQKLDSTLSDLADPQIKTEHKTIAVFNGTDHPQLGSKASRLVNNLGGNVIIVTNYDSKIAYTQVTGEKSKTLDRLKQIFGPPADTVSKDDTIVKIKDQILARAQINVFLGEDYFKNQ